MFKIYFNDLQLSLLSAALACLLLSLFFYLRGRENITVVLIMLAAFFTNSFAATLDPFLNLWDERFHALAAKNLMTHPFFPTLYDDPVVNMPYDRWDRYHIWLHKQPLFLWQIAACFRLFGPSEFPLRLPSVLLGTLVVLAAYRSGKLLVNKNTGYFTALLIITSTFLLELISGRQELDQNDFAFFAYISLSIWAFIEYYFTGKKRWLLLTAVFSGCAVLCKWVVGLLVYLGWFIIRLQEKKNTFSAFRDLILAFSVSLLVSVPWQLYIFSRFPSEALQAYRFNVNHFSIPLDGHSGDFLYHFNLFNVIYGHFASWLIFPAMLAFYFRIRDKKLFYALNAMVIAVYIFFSMTATKMPAFTTVVSLIIFIMLGCLADWIISFAGKASLPKAFPKAVLIVSFFLMLFLRFDFTGFEKRHSRWKANTSQTSVLIHNKKIFSSLELPDNTVLFNVLGRHYIEAMFYLGFPAYNFIPSESQFADMKNKNRRVAIFAPDNGMLPSYMQNDSTVIIIHEQLQGGE
jgi:4-amino-4-deoxy-L-arabinose transferase-like glycosyltransferase